MDDDNLQLYHYRLRSYDPDRGRFLQRDPLVVLDVPFPERLTLKKRNHNSTSIAQRLAGIIPDRISVTTALMEQIGRLKPNEYVNLYNYVSNRPIVLTDPTGGCGETPATDVPCDFTSHNKENRKGFTFEKECETEDGCSGKKKCNNRYNCEGVSGGAKWVYQDTVCGDCN